MSSLMSIQLPRKGNTTNHPVKYDKAFRKGFLVVYEEERTITAAAERYGVPRCGNGLDSKGQMV